MLASCYHLYILELPLLCPSATILFSMSFQNALASTTSQISSVGIFRSETVILKVEKHQYASLLHRV